jgi:hypothetical protein
MRYRTAHLTAVYRENRPTLRFPSRIPVENERHSRVWPDSPLLFTDFTEELMSSSKKCSPQTTELIYLMRDLGDLYLLHVKNRREQATDQQLDLSSSDAGYEDAVRTIYEKVLWLPTATDPDTPVYHDWVYETCRIAALIFTLAISHSIPFSQVNDLYQDSYRASFDGLHGELIASTSSLSSALQKAQNKSVVDSVWDELGGFLSWASLMGVCASRNNSTSMDELLARRWHTMICLRLFTPLGFEYPGSSMAMLAKLLEIMDGLYDPLNGVLV